MKSAAIIIAALVSRVLGRVAVAGVNIGGCDWGCDNNGYCGGTNCPTEMGPGQMQHFAYDDGLNIFRLPVGWQYLVNYNPGGPLDPDFFANYNSLVQACLQTGARCIIDIHNYARYNGSSNIIGQGGPSNDDFASLWSQLASAYADQPNVVMGIMNEPHDLDVPTWADTLQQVVNAIRNAGAWSQWILLPGTDYTSAGDFQYTSGDALKAVTNPDGSTDNLFFEVHRYYDYDNSGTHTSCSTDHIGDTFQYLAGWLRDNGRMALLAETGGGNTDECVADVCAALSYMNDNSDVFLGWVGWAAGAFSPDYELSEVPNGNQDTYLVSQCIAGLFH